MCDEKRLTPVPSQRLDIWNAPARKNSQGLGRPRQSRDISAEQHLGVFKSTSGMHGRIHGKQKQWLKRVTGSALISVSWENAKEFSAIVRSFQRGWSLSLLIMWRAAAAVLGSLSDLLCFHTSVQSDQDVQRQCGASSFPHHVSALSFLWQRIMAASELMALLDRERELLQCKGGGGGNHYPKTCSIMWWILFCQAQCFGASVLEMIRACNRDVIIR